jgi:isopentenyldiphosphate isomerase
MAYPPVVIVDKKDRVVGLASLAEAWEKKLLHRLVFIIVENSQGQILLHKRAPNMQLYAGRWDTTGGHVDVTPDYEESARIEVREEVGIRDLDLEEVGRTYSEDPYDNGAVAHRFIRIFRAYYDGQPGELGNDEAVATKWFTKAEIAKLVREHPELVAEGLYRCLPYILDTDENHLDQTTSQTN